MMKKVLIISFLIFTILASLVSTSYAQVAVTKKNLTETFKNYVSSEANEDNYTISVEDTVINLTKGTNTYQLNYDLTDKPTFSFEVSIEKGMSYEDFKNQENNLFLPMLGYIATTNIQGVSLEDSVAYFSFSYLGNALSSGSIENSYMIVDDLNLEEGVTIKKTDDPKTIYTSEFGDRVMEYVNTLYSKTQTISDTDDANSYMMTIEKTDVKETSCKLKSTLTVNIDDADFSKFSGTMDKIEDSFNNISNNITTNNTSNQLQESVNKVTNSTNKLPQTGDFFNIQDGLFFLILGCIAGIAFLLIPNMKYKNIEK